MLSNDNCMTCHNLSFAKPSRKKTKNQNKKQKKQKTNKKKNKKTAGVQLYGETSVYTRISSWLPVKFVTEKFCIGQLFETCTNSKFAASKRFSSGVLELSEEKKQRKDKNCED